MSRPLPYIPADLLDEAREAIRLGSSISYVAGQLGLSTDELERLLGRPQWKSIPADADDASTDLWAGEGQL